MSFPIADGVGAWVPHGRFVIVTPRRKLSRYSRISALRMKPCGSEPL